MCIENKGELLLAAVALGHSKKSMLFLEFPAAFLIKLARYAAFAAASGGSLLEGAVMASVYSSGGESGEEDDDDGHTMAFS